MHLLLSCFAVVSRFENFDLKNIVTPINALRLEELLVGSGYNRNETEFLVKGFTNGFDIGYAGPQVRQHKSRNIPLKCGVGNKFELWEKIMKEVKLKRFARPFAEIPFDNYIQSPVGLVPKAGGQTRLIFHLSYNFSDDLERDGSVNYFTP